MKRVIMSIVCVILAIAMSLPSMAAGLDADKQKILDAVNQAITVNGKTAGLPANQKSQAENYLKRDDIAITEDQANTAVEQIDKAVNILKAANVDSPDQLSSSDKAKLIDRMQKAANAIGLSVSVNSANNAITILDKNHTIVASFENVIKTTGPDIRMAAAVFGCALVLLAGCAVAAHKMKLGVQ